MLLIRHGESESDLEDLYGGWYDDNLTPAGRQQVEALIGELRERKIPVGVVLTSPLKRAQQTAVPLALANSVELHTLEDFKECNRYGELTGKPKSEGQRLYPEIAAALGSDYHAHFPGGEDYDQLFKPRILDAFQEATSKYPTEGLTIVTHGGPLRCILREVVGMPEITHLGDCAWVEIVMDQGQRYVGASSGIVWESDGRP